MILWNVIFNLKGGIFVKETIKLKGLRDYLEDDPSLAQKITYEEYMNKAATPQCSDIPIETAYANYKKIVYGQ